MSERQLRSIPSRRTSLGSSNGGDDNDIRERLAALEAHMQHIATKAWVLAGVLGGMGIAATIAVAVAKILFDNQSGQ